LDPIRLHLETEAYEEALARSEALLAEGGERDGLSVSQREELWQSRLAALWHLGRAREAQRLLGSPEVVALRRATADPSAWDAVERDILWELGCYEDVLALCRKYTREPSAAPSARRLAGFHHVEGLTLMRLGRGDEGLEALETARVLYRQVGDKVGEADTRVALGIQAKNRCAWEIAAEHLQGALQLYLASGAWARTAHVALNLGIVQMKSGQLTEASRSLALALRRSRRTAEPVLRARIHLAILLLYRRRGELTKACHAARRAAELLDGVPSPREAALLDEFRADLELEEGRPGEALALLDRALERAKPVARDGDVVCEVLRRKAEVFLELGRVAEARQHAREAWKMARGVPDALEEAVASGLAAAAELSDGPLRDRLARACEAFRLCGRVSDPFEQGRLGLRILERAVSRLRQEAVEKVEEETAGMLRELGMEARCLLGRCGRRDLAARCDALLEELRPLCRGRGEEHARGARPSGHYRRHRRLASGIFLTRDRRLLATLRDLEIMARTELPILIVGESGTGKELIARAIHEASPRREAPFVPINCGAIPQELQESEFFGHVRGAFTGAAGDKPGLFELAHRGTVFLDEIGEMEPRAQVKLLRILESGELRRVGETELRHVDVRIVAATNADLERQLEEGRFRHDLYFRIRGYKVLLPPLRERPCDVPILVEHLLGQICAPGEPRPRLTAEAMQRLVAYAWPGNVRELRHVLERAVAYARVTGSLEVGPEALGIPGNGGPPGNGATAAQEVPLDVSLPLRVPLDRFLEETERDIILLALEENDWNRTRTAKALGGISRTTLIGKMKRLGLFRDSRQ
jgi:two-component system response regulator PilR (NtrC family)